MNKHRILVELESFLKFGRKFYNANLVVRNAQGHEFVHRIGEFAYRTTVAELHHQASVVRVTHETSISEFIRIGETTIEGEQK